MASTSASDQELHSAGYVHAIIETGRLLPSAGKWNSIEIDYNLFPKSSKFTGYESLPSNYSKSIEFNLVITDKDYFKRFVYLSISVVLVVIFLILLFSFLPHKHTHNGSSKNLTFALNQALTFFDAQKSGPYPRNSSVKFRGDSGLQDGTADVNLVGGFYDSGNNIKFSFPTAYTISLLSWTVIEYHEKYEDIGELDNVKDIIKWGCDYLLKLFSANTTIPASTILYSQIGSATNDITCWQRPEDMTYSRPVSKCDNTATDLAGEIVAALSAASLVLKDDKSYSQELRKSAENLFKIIANVYKSKQGTYTSDKECGGDATTFYNSTSYRDELVWGGIWLSFATGNTSYLEIATENLALAEKEEADSDQGVFYWNNKLTANAVLLTRVRFFLDLGNPFEAALNSSSSRVDSLMCSYLSDKDNARFQKTEGGLKLLKPENGALLQFAATASFLSKLYGDYLDLLRRSGGTCSDSHYSIDMLHRFSTSQVDYILGENPMKMSYVVGFGDRYPSHVHHRSASIPWDGHKYSCGTEGDRWFNSEDPNPNILLGAMVAGPDQDDNFFDQRDKPRFTEPTIASNAGLIAALIALHDPPSVVNKNRIGSGIDKMGIFANIRFPPSSP